MRQVHCVIDNIVYIVDWAENCPLFGEGGHCALNVITYACQHVYNVIARVQYIIVVTRSLCGEVG